MKLQILLSTHQLHNPINVVTPNLLCPLKQKCFLADKGERERENRLLRVAGVNTFLDCSTGGSGRALRARLLFSYYSEHYQETCLYQCEAFETLEKL